MSPPRSLTLDHFTPYLGERLPLVLQEGGRTDAVLLEAAALEEVPSAGAEEGFSLLLHVPAAEHLPQRIYELEHPREGTVSLFLVPVGMRDGGILLEAVFN